MKKFHLLIAAASLCAVVGLVVPAGAAVHSSGASKSTSQAASTVSAPTATTATLPQGEAMYNGSVINLAQSWGSATSCIVPATGNAECFATQAQAKVAANAISTQEAATDQAAAASAQIRGNARSAAAALKGNVRGAKDDGPCEGDDTQWLWLYQNSDFGGGSLGIQGTDAWANLAGDGFADNMSSYINDTGCEVYMIQTYDGSGPWLYVSGWTYSTYVGNAWNDKVTMVYIAD